MLATASDWRATWLARVPCGDPDVIRHTRAHPRRDDMPLVTDPPVALAPEVSTSALPASAAFATEYDAIVAAIGTYIAGGRAGNSALMRPSFLADATMVGHAGGELFTGTIERLYEWIDANGPAPDLVTRFASVDIHETIAVVHLEAERWSGKFTGTDTHMSDAFTLVKTSEGWRIAHKIFHWYA
jgi:hypothetical protein